MPQQYRMPEPESFSAEHPATGAKVYSRLSDVPLYVDVTIISAPGALAGLTKEPLGPQARVFRLGWVIEEARWSRSWLAGRMAGPFLDWAAERIREEYPNHAEATGMSLEEVETIKAEQAEKRAEKAGMSKKRLWDMKYKAEKRAEKAEIAKQRNRA